MARNYNADATDDDALCTYPAEDYLDCDGNRSTMPTAMASVTRRKCPAVPMKRRATTTPMPPTTTTLVSTRKRFRLRWQPVGTRPLHPDCTFDPPVEDYTVECLADLVDMTCRARLALNTCTGATYDEIACVSMPSDQPYMAGEATTAFGSGPDAALRIYGLSMTGFADSDYFIESGDGLTFSQYANGVAILEGSVVNELNPNQGFYLFYVFY